MLCDCDDDFEADCVNEHVVVGVKVEVAVRLWDSVDDTVEEAAVVMEAVVEAVCVRVDEGVVVPVRVAAPDGVSEAEALWVAVPDEESVTPCERVPVIVGLGGIEPDWVRDRIWDPDAVTDGVTVGVKLALLGGTANSEMHGVFPPGMG
jgi:hypothetical protein